MFQKNVSVPAVIVPELPGSLESVIDRVDAAVRARRHVEEVPRTSIGSMEEAQREVSAVRERLAAAETESALANGKVDADLRWRYTVSRDAIDVCEVRIQGLQNKRAEALRDENEARLHLSREFSAWRREQHAAIRGDLEDAVERFVGDVRRVYAAAIAVGDSRVISCIGNLQVSMPVEQRNACNPQRLDWKNDPAAVAVHGKFSSVCAAVTPMLGELADVPVPAAPVERDGAA